MIGDKGLSGDMPRTPTSDGQESNHKCWSDLAKIEYLRTSTNECTGADLIGEGTYSPRK